MSSRTTEVDPTNQAQAGAWDGAEGGYWAVHADRFDRSLERYHPAFMRAAAIEPGSRVLDIGCGTGQTTRDAARLAPEGSAFGVDLSSEMIDVARRLAEREGTANARFAHADAQVHPFDEGAFDIAISRTGSMFFGQPHVAFANIARALRPGGRLVLLSWQRPDRNEWIGAFARALTGRDLPAPPPGSPSPFSQSDPDDVRALLAGTGFTDVRLADLAEPMTYGRDADDAHEFVLGLLGWMLQGREPAERQSAADALHAVMKAHEGPGGVQFASAAWLVTATRA
ncbi:methyltransferase domain-containing protein [Actinoplanes sp. NPDC051633]|uniref:class I SAM-dependent methyltransferase n=1 Tax=Actinoplanes sp. NPDC051633 TaxID=3155670 RepID=UPI003416A6F9